MRERKASPKGDARHKWEAILPFSKQVRCAKCGIETSESQARRGIGPCRGKKEKETATI